MIHIIVLCRPLRTQEEEATFTLVDHDSKHDQSVKEELKFEWAPPGITLSLAQKDMESLPNKFIPAQGSEGAIRRRRQLENLFPLHDVDHSLCHQMTQTEEKM